MTRVTNKAVEVLRTFCLFHTIVIKMIEELATVSTIVAQKKD